MDKIPLNHDQLVALGVLLALMLIFGLSFWRRRQNFLYNLSHLVQAIVAAGVVYWIFLSVPQLQPAAAVVSGIVGVLMYFRRPSRKRRTRTEVRRRVIAKWVASTGKKFNPRTHEIDHIVPFAKGGGETEDNLRVIERKRNRSKGAKSPWWDLMGR